MGVSRSWPGLSHGLALAAAGTGSLTVVEGAAGIGKTRVLDELAQRLAGPRFGVGGAPRTADEAATGSALRPVVRRAAWTPAALGRSGQPAFPAAPNAARRTWYSAAGCWTASRGERLRLQDAIVELVDELAAATPRLVLLDDVQWADSGSLAGAVAPRSPSPRPGRGHRHRDSTMAPAGGLAAVLERVQRAGGCSPSLPPLAADAIDLVVHDVSGGTPGEALRQRLAAAGGNPFYLEELLRSALADGSLVVEGGIAHLATQTTPRSVDTDPAERVEALPDDAAELVRALAVLGGAVHIL